MQVNKEELLGSYFDEALENLLKVLKIPSEQGKSEENAIFGKETREALEFTLNLAKRWGLKTYLEPQGYYGYFDYGSGEDMFLIAPHLDVVTTGNLAGWDNPPYQPIIKDNKIFARGAVDDKGPAYMVLYAIKYLVDKKYQPNNFVIRVLFGLDEEKEMRCLKKYIEDNESPTLGFTPDGAFPCIYAEKGVLNVDLKGIFKSNFTIKKASQAKDYNVVIDHVIYTGPKIPEIQAFLKENKITTNLLENNLHVYGKPAHGSLPELGINAALWLLKALDTLKINHPLVQFSTKYLFNNFEISGIVGDISDETGKLSTCVAYISVDNEKFKLGINFQVPATKLDQKYVIPDLEITAEKYGIKVQVKNSLPPTYFRQDRSIVQKILKTYQKITGNQQPPLALGIGTYAKVIPNIIACGILEEEASMSSPHQYNEWVKIDNLKHALLVYTNLIVEFTK